FTVQQGNNPQERWFALRSACRHLRQHLKEIVPKPDDDLLELGRRGTISDPLDLTRVLVHDGPYSDSRGPSYGWAHLWSLEHPLEALLLLRRASRSTVTPEETAILAQSEDQRVRSMVLLSLSQLPLAPAASPDQLRRVRRPHHRR